MFIISMILNVVTLLFVARVLLSWFPDIDRNSPIVRFIYDTTEPVLQPIRQALPPTGMIDLSPLVVFVGIQVIRMILRV